MSELDDGRLPEAVSPDLPPTVDYEESSNIACYDCRKQDVLPLCPLSPKITKLIQGPSFSYKDYNTPARLGELTDSKLLSLGVSDKEDRRLVLSALNAAGYRAIAVTTAKHQDAKKRRIANRTPGAKDDNDDEDENSTSLSREPSTVIIRLRLPKHDDTGIPSSSSSPSRLLENEFLPGQDADEEGAASLDDLNFHEILDEDALRHKFTVVNRAPVMMAWTCVVAERLGFSRDEALSIGTSRHVNADFLLSLVAFFTFSYCNNSYRLNSFFFSLGIHRNECGLQRCLARHL